jgi:hypothetical protein
MIGLTAMGAVVVVLLRPASAEREAAHDKALRQMADGALSYYAAEICFTDGRVPPRTVPDSARSTARLCPPEAGPDTPTWHALRFDVPVGLRAEFIRRGPARFIARVHGDTDCDGIESTFERRCTIDPDDAVLACTRHAFRADE